MYIECAHAYFSRILILSLTNRKEIEDDKFFSFLSIVDLFTIQKREKIVATLLAYTVGVFEMYGIGSVGLPEDNISINGNVERK